MPQFTIFNTATRSIMQSGTHPDPASIPLQDGQQLDLSGAYPDDIFTYGEDDKPVALQASKSPEELQREIVTATQSRLDEFARTRGYDGILSAASYAASTVPQFAAEGQCAAIARDQTWAALYALLAEVHAGTRSIPSGYADIESDLPALAWPA